MTELNIYGVIGQDVIDTEFISKLKQSNGDLRININSNGGSVFQGHAIYNAIREYKGFVQIHIDGVAASMASLICLAGNRVIMASNALYMIHNPRLTANGDREELQRNMNLLDKVKETMLEVYHNKTKIPKEELSQLLDKETWLTASEALKKGFIDEVKGSVLTPNSFANTSFMPANNRSSWSLEDWTEKDPKGLNDLLNSNPAEFARLNSEHYGTELKSVNSPNPTTTQVYNSIPVSRSSWGLKDWIEKDPKGLNDLQNTNPNEFTRLNNEYYSNY